MNVFISNFRYLWDYAKQHRVVLWTTLLLFFMCTHNVAIEGGAINPLKTGVMCLAVFSVLFIKHTSKALLLGGMYWGWCYLAALMAGPVRFSTLGFLAMHIFSFVALYGLIRSKYFTLDYFVKFVTFMIQLYAVVLILQQLCILVGIRNCPPINLCNQFYLSITKLPSLHIEPSSAARTLTVLMLCYLRCEPLTRRRRMIDIKELFSKEHRLVSFPFLWTMLTMGSGTAFAGLGILSLYFVRAKTCIVAIPALIGLVYVGEMMEVEQMGRATRLATAVASGADIQEMEDADGSGASRIIPMINTLTKTDLTDLSSWIGMGTGERQQAIVMADKTRKMGNIVQYGIIGFVLSLTFVYSCIISKFISLETLIFVLLLGFAVGNVTYGWGILMLIAVSSYFVKKYGSVSSIACK